MSDTNKTVDFKKLDVDADLNVKADIDADVDVNLSKSNVDIDVYAHTYDPHVKVEYVDVNHKYESEFTATLNKNINKTDYTDTWTTTVHVEAANIIDDSIYHVEHDEDINDVDTSGLLNVDGTASLSDFSVDQVAIGNSFNGEGNDSQYNLNQTNNLVDNDHVGGTSAHYVNLQAPNLHATVDADYKETYHPYAVVDIVNATGNAAAPHAPFQAVHADGDYAKSDDGISSAQLNDAASDNVGEGRIAGSTSADASGNGSAEAFTVSIQAGGNQLANFATLNIVGGDKTDAEGIKGGGYDDYGSKTGGSNVPPDQTSDGDGLAIRDSHYTEAFDDDVNDLDTSGLLNVSKGATLNMDDFDLDILAIGGSFNGAGNDMQFDFNQVNDLVDNDSVHGTSVGYYGAGFNAPFQSVSAYGGHGEAGDGIGHITGHGAASSNGAAGVISGSSAASGAAFASAEAFSVNVVVGANVLVNNFSATVVGGDSTMADDIGG